jgi:hypothetical protein
MVNAYRDDLAYIHDAGFDNLARHAAAVLLDSLQQRGIDRGLVIDLGCGSGILAQVLAAAGEVGGHNRPLAVFSLQSGEKERATGREGCPRCPTTVPAPAS